MKEVDVVIVGAGPAGSATAIGLAQRGYEVAVIDKKIFPREKLCGDFVNPINWPVFRELGVTERVLAAPHGEVSGFRLTTSSGREAEAGFIARDGQRSMGLGLQRAALDQLLVQRAAELGVSIYPGRRIERIFAARQGWRLESAMESWQARLVVGADGRNSWVARQVGLDRGASMHGRAIGFQSRLRCPGASRGKIEIHLFPGGYAGVVDVGDGTITLGMAIDKRKLSRAGGAQFLFTGLLAHNPHLKSILDRSADGASLRSVYPVYFSRARAVAERVVLVGDAARVSEPVTGEGIYFAMRSGLLAAATIDQAFRQGNLAAQVLADYERLCRTAFRSRLALNALLRFAVYRPALLEPFIRLSTKNNPVLNSLISAVCAT